MRFLMISTLVVFPALSYERLPASRDRIVVVCRCGVAAYAEALEGIRERLGQDPETIDLDKAGTSGIAAIGRRLPGDIYIAIGQEALLAASAVKPPVPVVATMILQGDAAPDGVASEVNLDVPP